jgi:alkanesulfonate monooxygenase SsuD/methylene tetrahydromethanopterin reductase-like flavin-dependent oxidoreductase (luciferase family)
MADNGATATIADGRAWPASDKAVTFGLMMPLFEDPETRTAPSFEEMAALGLEARSSGFDALWIADHFVMGNGSEEQPFLGVWESFTLMAGLAARVPDLQIGSMVVCTGFRNPGVVAKMAEMIDEISGGRFILGLGAGWHKPEYDLYGLPFDHRYSRFEDAIRIIHPLLRTGKADYQGEFYQANDALNVPRGPRETGVPIIVGSNGERMLGLIAQHADAWNTAWHRDTSKVGPQLAALEAACAEVGRDPESVVKTGGLYFDDSFGSGPDDAANAARLIGEFRDLGFSHLILQSFPLTPVKLEAFAAAIEMVHAGDAG